jgi:hypothetical protein
VHAVDGMTASGSPKVCRARRVMAAAATGQRKNNVYTLLAGDHAQLRRCIRRRTRITDRHHGRQAKGDAVLESIAALATAAGTTLVTAMATDAWQAARTGIARLFSRTGTASQAAVEEQLDRHQEMVVRAEDPDQVRQRLVAGWQAEIELMLQREPDVAPSLASLLEEVQRILPPTATRGIVQNVHVSGSGNLTNVVAGGNVIHHNMPATQPQTGPAPEGGA